MGWAMALRQFGELEAVVMDRLWGYGRPVPVREVVEDLKGIVRSLTRPC